MKQFVCKATEQEAGQLVQWTRPCSYRASLPYSDVHIASEKTRRLPGKPEQQQTLCGRWYDRDASWQVEPNEWAARELMCKRCAAAREGTHGA